MSEFIIVVQVLWLLITVLFSFVGQGIISFVIVRLIHNKFFRSPVDVRDVRIDVLEDRLAELQSDKNKLSELNGQLLVLMAQGFTKHNG